MNEKIRELAEQAGMGFTLWDDSGREMIDNYTPEECLEKFAELIVAECADFADEHNDASEGVTLGVGRALKQYFGVEP
jgi:hypothetical protein